MTHDSSLTFAKSDEDAVTKTYLTTDQFIKVGQSLDEPKQKELHAAWNAARYAAWDAAWNATWYSAWYAARDAARDDAWDDAWCAAWYDALCAAWDADLAILVKNKISNEQFETLTSPWTSCGLSLYAEDWDEVLNPKVVEPKNFGAIVEATYNGARGLFFNDGTKTVPWCARNESANCFWDELINPIIISEGVEGWKISTN